MAPPSPPCTHPCGAVEQGLQPRPASFDGEVGGDGFPAPGQNPRLGPWRENGWNASNADRLALGPGLALAAASRSGLDTAQPGATELGVLERDPLALILLKRQRRSLRAPAREQQGRTRRQHTHGGADP